MASRPDIHPRVLRYFIALAEAGTYTRAAALLHVATPSLSQQISRLEAVLEVRLVERDHRGARLTPAGEEFLTAARHMLLLHDRMIARVREHGHKNPERVRIGFYSTVAGPRTRSILTALHRLSPSTKVELVQLGWGEQVTAVLQGKVDASFARPPLTETGIQVFPVLTEKRVAVMSVHHHLAARETLHIGDLAGVTQVDTDNVSDEWRRWWAVDPRPDGVATVYGPMVHSVEEMLEVIANSDVIGITAESLAEILPRKDIAYRPITDIEPAQVVLVVPEEMGPTTFLLSRSLEEAQL